MDLLTVLTQCSLPTDFTLVLALALTFSNGQPLTVKTVDELAYGYGSEELQLDAPQSRSVESRPLTRQQAIAKLHSFSAESPAGATVGVLVGLLPVPRSWAALYQRSEEELLDPCTNVSIASAQLSEFEELCAGKRDSRQCALQHYADAAGAPLLADDVRETIVQQSLPSSPSATINVTTEAMLSSTVFAETDGLPRTWGADRIFIPSPQESARRPSAKQQPAKQQQNPTKPRGAK